jgi:DNA-binding CsgD family transcriptional regulator
MHCTPGAGRPGIAGAGAGDPSRAGDGERKAGPCALAPPALQEAIIVRIGGEEFAALTWTSPPAAMLGLTPAERDVVRLILDGRTNSQIAASRGCSTGTVAKQVASAFRKLRVHCRSELCASTGGPGR